MNSRYYECHVTCQGVSAEVEPAVSAIGWTFSAIDNDIILGPGVKCYATKHFNERIGEAKAISHVLIAAETLKHHGIKVIRAKVELVVFDKRGL